MYYSTVIEGVDHFIFPSRLHVHFFRGRKLTSGLNTYVPAFEMHRPEAENTPSDFINVCIYVGR
jgi:hypothetical protein